MDAPLRQPISDKNGIVDFVWAKFFRELVSSAGTALTGAISTVLTTNLTANRAVISNDNGKIAASDVTDTELSYLEGARSNIQDQIDDVNGISQTEADLLYLKLNQSSPESVTGGSPIFTEPLIDEALVNSLDTNARILYKSDGTTPSLDWENDTPVVDVTATSPITSTGGATPDISTSMATNKLIGRGTAGTGVFEEITLGTNISLTGTTLNVPNGAGGVSSFTITQPAAGITATNSGATQTGAATTTLALANDLSAVEGLSGTGLATRTASDTWTTRSVAGTANRITVNDGDGVSGNPTVDIANNYIGQNTITTLGTVTTGTWNGTVVDVPYGGSNRASATAYMPICGGTTSTAAHQSVATGSVNQVLTYVSSSALPTFQDPPVKMASFRSIDNASSTTPGSVDGTLPYTYYDVVLGATTQGNVIITGSSSDWAANSATKFEWVYNGSSAAWAQITLITWSDGSTTSPYYFLGAHLNGTYTGDQFGMISNSSYHNPQTVGWAGAVSNGDVIAFKVAQTNGTARAITFKNSICHIISTRINT